jgi:hypothetical protein
VQLWQETPQRGTMRDPVVPDDCPQEVADVIAACTQRNADARPSAKEVCRWVLDSCHDCVLQTRSACSTEAAVCRCVACPLACSANPPPIAARGSARMRTHLCHLQDAVPRDAGVG